MQIFKSYIFADICHESLRSLFINKKSSYINEINVGNLYKKYKCTCICATARNWVMILDEYQDIEDIEGFYNYVTNT